ncbi:phospholipase D family protein,nuclease NucT,cardiolipin synthase,Archaeal transcriptional regulator TrmB [Chlamydia suis]|uniref:phospholipase D-like domain-containing protein n=1 Tax=Chlamydia suis TaxID=83559 RepID=UPI0009B0E2ED|nr:phospholipase D-like domain-containing protein [Chlamydia suis]SIU03182.1 phospholipase D family protein,nuclease NucT,cardiolipin synthase,Archaeal transcriptional regulator TrmB [Chlamydia suis]
MRIQELGNHNSYWDCESSDSDSEESLVDGSHFGACGGITPAPLNDLNSQNISTLAPLTIRNIPASSSLNPNAQEFIPRTLSTAPINNSNTAPSLLPIASSCLNIPVTETPSTHNSPTLPTIQSFPGYPGRIQQHSISSFSAHPPTNTAPIQILARECGHDLTEEICAAIRSAQNNIRIKIYSLSSRAVLRALAEKASQGVSVWIHYQLIQNHEPFGLDKHPLVRLQRNTKTHTNLLHKKEIIVDQKLALLGSANFTYGALTGDVNCLIKVLSPELCRLMKQNRSGDCPVGERNCRYLSLYRLGPDAAPEIIRHIDNANHSIRLMMFVLSHEGILRALDRAHRRGVKVEIIVDTQHRKATFDILQKLRSDIKIFEGTTCGLVHCKMCTVDDTLIVGSVNWSNKGFLHNTENLFFIPQLSPQEHASLSQIWYQTLAHSELVTSENVTIRRTLASLRPYRAQTSSPDSED